MEFDFAAYVKDFNLNDDASLIRKYYKPDAVIEGPDRTFKNREEWLDVLKFSHNGVREELHPIMVVREGDRMMAELNIVFTPSIDRPDFPAAPLKAGKPLKMRFFASYVLRDGQIAELHLGWWTPGLRAV